MWLTNPQTIQIVLIVFICLKKYFNFQNMNSDDLNYAALSFQTKAKRSRRPATQSEPEPNVVYAATR